MELYFLRHGIAEERDPSRFPRDFDRPLTSEGTRKVRRIARAMKALGLEFDLILSSPYVRAQETADIVARSLKLQKRLQLVSELEVESSPQGLVRGLLRRELPQRVLLVGHEPLFSETMALLICGHSGLDLTMKKGGLGLLTVVCLKVGRCAVLEWLLTPKQLGAIK